MIDTTGGAVPTDLIKTLWVNGQPVPARIEFASTQRYGLDGGAAEAKQQRTPKRGGQAKSGKHGRRCKGKKGGKGRKGSAEHRAGGQLRSRRMKANRRLARSRRRRDA